MGGNSGRAYITFLVHVGLVHLFPGRARVWRAQVGDLQTVRRRRECVTLTYRYEH